MSLQKGLATNKAVGGKCLERSRLMEWCTVFEVPLLSDPDCDAQLQEWQSIQSVPFHSELSPSQMSQPGWTLQQWEYWPLWDHTDEPELVWGKGSY